MKKRKAFLFGFLVLAMVTLLSGMVRSNNVVDQSSTIITTVQPPGEFIPTFDLNVIVSPAATWYCTLNPGYQDQRSANVTDEAVIYADVLRTKYINLSKLNKRYYTQTKPESITTDNNYRKPRDGLRQSWQA